MEKSSLYRVVATKPGAELRVWGEGQPHEWWSISFTDGKRLGRVGARDYIRRHWCALPKLEA